MVVRLARKLKRASALTLADWRYLLIAVLELARARIRHATTPTGQILQQLQRDVSCGWGQNEGAAKHVDLERFSWAISSAAAHVPWRSDCLLQVMAADRWLRHQGYTPSFYLGVAKDQSGNLAAHAWLRCTST